jgi:hypothetical protein
VASNLIKWMYDSDLLSEEAVLTWAAAGHSAAGEEEAAELDGLAIGSACSGINVVDSSVGADHALNTD